MSPENGSGPTPRELSVHLVGTDEVKTRAAEVSEQRLIDKLQGDGEGRLKRLRQVGRNIWYGNMAREHYLSKYSREARAEIIDSGNLYVHEGLDKSAHDDAMEATVMRFEALDDELLHKEAGEARGEALPDDEAGSDIKGRLQEVIKQFARGDFEGHPEAFEEEKHRVLSELAKEYPNYFEMTRLYADNLTNIGVQVKNAVQAGEDMDRVVGDIKFYIDKAHTGVRTEVELNRIDKALDFLKEHHITTNETAVAGAVSLAYSVARYSARTGLGVISKLTIPGVSTGILAGMRENKRIKEERSHHSRERAQGGDFAPNAERRKEMESTRYETVAAQDLEDSLLLQFREVNEDGETVDRELGPHELALAMVNLSRVMARQRLSDREGIDLIHFSSIEKVDYERTSLDVAMAHAKVVLRRQFGEQNGGDTDRFDRILEEQVGAQIAALESEIDSKDRVFNILKRREVGKAAAKGMLIGMTLGTISQELMSVVRPDEHGLADSLLHHQKADGAHQTLLRHMLMGKDKHVVDSGQSAPVPVGDGALQLPSNVHLISGSGGGYALEGPGHHIFADNLHFNPDGSLDDHSSALLHQMGVTESVSHLAPTGTVSEHVVSPDEFVGRHADKMIHVKRDGWYDNNTPMYRDSSGRLVGADQNELKLWWGGNDNTGLDDHGNIVMDVSHMTSNGSFHAGTSVDAANEIQSGRMVALVTASRGTQDTAFEVPIGSNGQMIIDPHSEVARLFQNSNGHEVFNGGYVEIAQLKGSEAGIEHVNILATHVGENASQVTDIVPGQVTQHAVTVLRNFNRPVATEIDVPPVVPIVPRDGLERMMEPVPAPETSADQEAQTSDEGESPDLPILSLFELKEMARHNVALLKESGDLTPVERKKIGANIGRITQHMKLAERRRQAAEAGQDPAQIKGQEVSQSDLAALYASFNMMHDRHPELISDDLLRQIQKSILASDLAIPNQSENGWEIGVSAPTESPSVSSPVKSSRLETERTSVPEPGTAATTIAETREKAERRAKQLDEAAEAFTRLATANPDVAEAIDLILAKDIKNISLSSTENGAMVELRDDGLVVRNPQTYRAVRDFLLLRSGSVTSSQIDKIIARINRYASSPRPRSAGAQTVAQSGSETPPDALKPKSSSTTSESSSLGEATDQARERILGLANSAFARLADADPTLKRALDLVDETDMQASQIVLSQEQSGPELVQRGSNLIIRGQRTYQAIQDYLRLRDSDGSELSNNQLNRLIRRLNRYARGAQKASLEGVTEPLEEPAVSPSETAQTAHVTEMKEDRSEAVRIPKNLPVQPRLVTVLANRAKNLGDLERIVQAYVDKGRLTYASDDPFDLNITSRADTGILAPILDRRDQIVEDTKVAHINETDFSDDAAGIENAVAVLRDVETVRELNAVRSKLADAGLMPVYRETERASSTARVLERAMPERLQDINKALASAVDRVYGVNRAAIST